MAENIDFFKFYAALGLPPRFTQEQFKRAYRRQVAALHPDQRGTAPPAPQNGTDHALLELQQLNHLYDAAMDFHRRHGRMPGMPTPRTPASAVPTPHPAPTPSVSLTAASPPSSAPLAETRFRLRYLVVMAVLIALVYAIERSDSPEPLALPPIPLETGRHEQPSPLPRQLFLGMTMEQAIELQGAPLSLHPARLDYGPSWIALRCGHVSDWYSSALRPLHVDSPSPSEPARQMVLASLPPDC